MLPSLPLPSCAEAQAFERRWFAGAEEREWAAMLRAGESLADALQRDAAEVGGWGARPVFLVLAGPGHNGGDALLAGAALARAQARGVVCVAFPLGERALRPLAARAWLHLQRAAAAGGAELRVLPAGAAGAEALASGQVGPCDAVIDGLYGMRFRPPLDPASRAWIDAVDTHPVRLRAAVDLPSGLGDVPDARPFRADFTYATGLCKAPLLDPRWRAWVGRVRWLDLGFDVSGLEAACSDRVLTDRVLDPLRALRPAVCDKRSFGHLLLLGGSRGYPGALLLAVQAALRSGVGLVTAFAPASLQPALAAAAPEAIWVPWPEGASGGLAPAGLPLLRERGARGTALLVGPGMGDAPESLATAAAALRALDLPCVIDADALRPQVLDGWTSRGASILTPHAGEWSRLAAASDEGGAEAALRRAASDPLRVVILKGPVTRVVGAGRYWHAPWGGPVLARAGSGDLLAGLVGGRLAAQPDRALEAAAQGTAWHGMAADKLARERGQFAVSSGELLEFLPKALRG